MKFKNNAQVKLLLIAVNKSLTNWSRDIYLIAWKSRQKRMKISNSMQHFKLLYKEIKWELQMLNVQHKNVKQLSGNYKKVAPAKGVQAVNIPYNG